MSRVSLRVQAEVDGAATIVSTVVETGSLQLALSYPNEGNGELVTINVGSALDIPEAVTLALVGVALLGIATTGRRKPALPCPLTSQPAFVGSPRCGGAAVAARNRRRDRHHRSARPAGGVERKLHRECSNRGGRRARSAFIHTHGPSDAETRVPAPASTGTTGYLGLCHRGSDPSEPWRGAAYYPDRLLKGAKPSEKKEGCHQHSFAMGAPR